MDHVIVTGANGFVGKAVLNELIKNGHFVYAVVRPGKAGECDFPKSEQITVIECDMKEYERLHTLIDDVHADTFYHFAWTGSAGALRGDPDIQIDNIRCSCNAVLAAARIGCKRFIMAGSIMEHEIDQLMREGHVPPISSLYSTAKLTADYMCRTLAVQNGLEYVCGLISNIYGPGEISPRFVNTTIRKMLNNEHIACTEGKQMYDFIYITDAARAFGALGEKGRNLETYYIGSLSPKPLREFLLEMKSAVGYEPELGFGEVPFVGEGLSYDSIDTQSLLRDTGIEPEVSFQEGVYLTMTWLRGK